MFVSDNESFNPSLWEEQRKQRAQVAFECDEDKDEREAPPRVSLLASSLNLRLIFKLMLHTYVLWYFVHTERFWIYYLSLRHLVIQNISQKNLRAM